MSQLWMPVAQQSVNLAVSSKDAVLSITAINTAKVPSVRAVLRVTGEKPYYGTTRRSAVETAQQLLSRYPERISEAERKRVLAVLQGDVTPRRFGSQPRSSRCVPIIHQIFGLCRNATSMPRLFEQSQRSWRYVAEQMGAQYHLWSADEVESLIKKNISYFGQHMRKPASQQYA